MKKICVLGLGYIGLPTATMFATHGFDVIGVDVKREIVDTLNNGSIHIDEPGLKTVVQAAFNSGNLKVKCEPEQSDIFIIAVPTPITRKKEANLSYVESASKSIIPYIESGNLIILESTSPPRTTVDIVLPLLEKSGLKVGRDINLAYSPERVLPGKILHELVHNSRVIGGVTPEGAKYSKEIYKSFVEGEIVLTDATTAEMVKLMENTYRDINIAIANEFSRLAEKFKMNVWEAIEIANRHPRVEILQPGPGVGGHCISVDPWFFVEKAPQEAQLIKKAREINDGQPDFVVRQLLDEFQPLKGKTFGVLGVTYKADVDDTRESPAIDVIEKIKGEGGIIKVYDPFVKKTSQKLDSLVDTLEETVSGVDGIILLVDHQQFDDIDPGKIIDLVNGRYVLDTRNCLDHKRWEDVGFKVRVLGNGKANVIS